MSLLCRPHTWALPDKPVRSSWSGGWLHNSAAALRATHACRGWCCTKGNRRADPMARFSPRRIHCRSRIAARSQAASVARDSVLQATGSGAAAPPAAWGSRSVPTGGSRSRGWQLRTRGRGRVWYSRTPSYGARRCSLPRHDGQPATLAPLHAIDTRVFPRLCAHRFPLMRRAQRCTLDDWPFTM